MAEDELTFRFRKHEPDPDRDSPLQWRGAGQCTFCASADTVWQHDLNASRSTFRTMFGKGTVWGGGQLLCGRCEDLYNAGEYAELARLETTVPPAYDDELAGNLVGLAAFCRADRGARPLPEPSFPEGYHPLNDLTGAEWLFDLWPVDRRMTVPETRHPQVDDDPEAVIRLISSPWPSISVTRVVPEMWRWVERDWDHDTTWDLMPGRAAELLGWPEEKMLAYLRTVED